VVRKVPRERIRPSALQPRRDFPAESLQELADSIREQGIIQPLVVRPVGDHFELIAGERRWRAAGLVGLAEVPVIERLATDLEVLELALIENLQRENLNPIEEALGYQQLMTQFSLTQEQVGIKVGRSRAVIANATRLLKLPASIQASVRDGSLSVGHAKVILGADDPERQETLARLSLRGGWTVRQLEAAVSAQGSLGKGAKADPRPKVVEPPVDPHLADLENRIRERVGLRVVLHYRAGLGGRFARGRGRLRPGGGREASRRGRTSPCRPCPPGLFPASPRPVMGHIRPVSGSRRRHRPCSTRLNSAPPSPPAWPPPRPKCRP